MIFLVLITWYSFFIFIYFLLNCHTALWSCVSATFCGSVSCKIAFIHFPWECHTLISVKYYEKWSSCICLFHDFLLHTCMKKPSSQFLFPTFDHSSSCSVEVLKSPFCPSWAFLQYCIFILSLKHSLKWSEIHTALRLL